MIIRRPLAAALLAGTVLLSACSSREEEIAAQANAQTAAAMAEAHKAQADAMRTAQEASRAVQQASGAAQAALANMPAMPASAPAGSVNPALAGRWSIGGSCEGFVELRADGTFIPPFGGEGQWRMDDTELTMPLEGSVVRSSVQMTDANTMVMTRDGGKVETVRRC